MKKALILVKVINPRHQFIKDFLNEKSKDHAEFLLKTFSDITFRIEKGNVECWCGELNLKDVDLVYFRQVGGKYVQLAGSIAPFLTKNKIKFIDKSFSEIGAAGNKLGNIVKLALNNIPIVPCYYVSREKLLKEKNKIISQFGLPLFTKDLSRQRRKGLFIINKEEDFEKLLLHNKVGKGFLIQKHIKIEKEYRLVVMGKKVVAVHEEQPRNFARNRMKVDSQESIGGWISPDRITRKMKNLVTKGSQVLDLNISGADACIEQVTGEIYIFEINRGPGLTLDPQISPELPELVKYFTKLL